MTAPHDGRSLGESYWQGWRDAEAKYRVPTYASEADRVRKETRMLLDPQTDAEADTVDWLCSTLSVPGSLALLRDMVHRATVQALRAGAHTGREECLNAVQAVIDEVDGGAS